MRFAVGHNGGTGPYQIGPSSLGSAMPGTATAGGTAILPPHEITSGAGAPDPGYHPESTHGYSYGTLANANHHQVLGPLAPLGPDPIVTLTFSAIVGGWALCELCGRAHKTTGGAPGCAPPERT